MYFVFFIFITLLLFCYLVFYKPAKVFLIFDTDAERLDLNLKWLFPFLDVKVHVLNPPFLTIYIFTKKIYSKAVRSKKNYVTEMLQYYRSLCLSGTHLSVYYSLNDPFYTGITSGIFHMMQTYFGNVLIEQYPNFISGHEYAALSGETSLNLGKTATRFIKMKFQNKKLKRSEQYGPA